MAVLISLNDNSAGDGFLLAPLDSTYDAQIKLRTDPATASTVVTLHSVAASDVTLPGPAGLVFSTLGPVTITPVDTIIAVHAMMQSNSRGDTVIQVREAGIPVANFIITSITNPVVNFSGRFEARFATAPALYNQNAMYKDPSVASTPETLDVAPGWTWGLEGEPNFVPVAGIIPENLETPGMGRVIRLNNPVSLRSPADSVISTVKSISGQTATSSETFFIGDPLINQPVNFGPDTYFAGNKEKSPLPTPQPEEYYSDAHEPMGLFEINLGNSSLYFRGASNVGVFDHKATFEGERTRVPDSRPICTVGLVGASAEILEKGLPSLASFSETRILDLKNQYVSLIAMGDVPSLQRRNLVRRIGHLLSAVSSATQTTVTAAAVAPDNFATPPRGRSAPFAYASKEIFNGKIDIRLHALPGGSSVIDYFRQFFSFNFQWHPFTFHSDELCGNHKGTLSGDTAMTGNHIGDPHVHTVNGINYDFQSVGEFTLLKDGSYMEVQVRQTPVATANPITDSYSDITACVSLNTAVAARVGTHRIAYQPTADKERARLQFFLDGKLAQLTAQEIDLDGNTVSTFDADGQIGLRIDYKDKTVITVTPRLWISYNVWYMDVSISNTPAKQGIMGHIPKKSWLPRLRNGQDVGSRPAAPSDRYNMLYKTFADSWRVTDATSLFVYVPGTSTKTFTDPDWPAQQAPCNMKPQFQIPGLPILQGMPIEKAEIACKLVTMDDLHKNCVFDVATTGDKTFVKGYLHAQELRLCGTSVQIAGYEPPSQEVRTAIVSTTQAPTFAGHSLIVIATVLPLTPGRPIPEGTVTYYINNKAVSERIKLDRNGNARWKVSGLDKGDHSIKAIFTPEDKKANHSSTSAGLTITITSDKLVSKGGGNRVSGGGGVFGRWCFWIVLLLVLLIIVWLLINR